LSEAETAITDIETPVYLQYNFTAGAAPSRFLSQLKRGVLTGQRCPRCANVYIPPRGSCPGCGVPTVEEVVLSNKATIESCWILSHTHPQKNKQGDDRVVYYCRHSHPQQTDQTAICGC
jgi:uncharacterized OB-fold protein